MFRAIAGFTRTQDRRAGLTFRSAFGSDLARLPGRGFRLGRARINPPSLCRPRSTGGWRLGVRPGCDKGAAIRGMERVMGIEPTLAAWEAAVLPLNYTRVCRQFYLTIPNC